LPLEELRVKFLISLVIGFVVMLAATAYLVRGLQLILGSSKRSIHERTEELGDEDDVIPLADSSISRIRQDSEVTLANSPAEDLSNDLIAPQRAQDPSLVRGTGGPPEYESQLPEVSRTRQILQAPLPLTRPQRWAALINANFDRITYAFLFIFVGIPIYYATGYAMPAQLTFNVLAYFAALALPLRWKQFLHPVLVSSAITILGIWILGLIRGDSLDDVLNIYKTGSNYLSFWHDDENIPRPGAGDVFGSVLDASIVALALPMYNYRGELKRHFFAIVIPNVVVSIGSLFGYPALCYAIGISSKRSLSFAARSLTLALATPAVRNLGGDLNTVAALAIMSGILGVLIGPRMLRWLRIPEGWIFPNYRSGKANAF
jgi:putative effector of murein hydrolase